MSGTVIGKSLGLGYAGKISRSPGNIVNAKFVKSILNGSNVETQPSIPFGFAAVLNEDNSYSKFGATGSGVAAPTAANFAGIAVAEVKQVYTYATNDPGEYTPLQPCDILQIGSATVFCKEGTPVAGGKVYIVTVAGTYADVGEFVAVATPAGSGATAIELTNVRWTTGKVDANKIAEVTILTKNNP
jgi:hypothetical protein